MVARPDAQEDGITEYDPFKDRRGSGARSMGGQRRALFDILSYNYLDAFDDKECLVLKCGQALTKMDGMF